MKKQAKKCNNKGYTLIELIVVISILLILGAVLSLSIVRYMDKARTAMDVHNATLIRDALLVYTFPENYQGQYVEYTDPETGAKERFKRGWVYVDKTEMRCSDASTALAMIDAGLVKVSEETALKIAEYEETPGGWYPSGPDGDFVYKSGIDEYVFKNNILVKSKINWNTYQLDVYLSEDGQLYLGASASNTQRTNGHEKDEKTAKLFANKIGLDGSRITPIGEQRQ